MVINKLVIKRPQVTIIGKKTWTLGNISLETRTELKKSFKDILNCCKLQIVFKTQRKLANVFRFKDCLSFLVFGVVYKYMCGRCSSSYYSETGRHLKVRSEEHIDILSLTVRKNKSSKESAIRDHLLNFNSTPSFDKFAIIWTLYIYSWN